MLHLERTRPLFRAVMVLAGLSCIGAGLAPMRHGGLFYANWWGGLVFALLAIILGFVFILGAIFKPQIFRSH
jgi:hypothetical protein